MTEFVYDEGGWIPPGLVEITLGVGECVVSSGDAKEARWRCCRTDFRHLDAMHPDSES